MRSVVVIGLMLVVGCRIDGPTPDEKIPVPADDTMGIDSSGASLEPPAPTAEQPVETPPSAASSSRRPASASGLVIPVAGIRPETLADTFEDARSEGRVHNAIDILAPRGTAVRAAVNGEIVRLFESEKGGRTIYQIDADTSGTRVYYYAHLDAYASGLAKGQRVAAGDVIGTVGDSGNAAPGNTHLHFAIWDAPSADDFWDGEPVNPYGLLVSSARQSP